jgi:hypothetical protein
MLTFPTFYTFFSPSTAQNSEQLENRRDEVLRLIYSLDDIWTACGGDRQEHQNKKMSAWKLLIVTTS